jgi:flagellar biosynthesis protein FlhB
MSEEDDDDKQYAPSQKRLDDARARGEIPKSTELNTAAAYAGFILACVIFGATALKTLGATAASLIDQSDRLAGLMFSGAKAPVLGALIKVASAVAPFFLLPALFVLGSLIAQRALHFAPEKLEFKASRVSPLAIAKQKFGREGLFEFAKSFAKLLVVSAILGFFLQAKSSQILMLHTLQSGQITSIMLNLIVQLLVLVAISIGCFGAADFLWQHAQHKRRNMMSRQEMVDEMKDSEGDPHVKQQRRQRGQEIATNQMLQDVPKADVIVVNPTHYAIALKWDRASRTAPVCIAKGVDEIAARIREKAMESGVPIHADPPTARAIYSTTPVGQQILPEHYRSVAAAIRFAEAMSRRKRSNKR